jgi:hypothetical protein
MCNVVWGRDEVLYWEFIDCWRSQWCVLRRKLRKDPALASLLNIIGLLRCQSIVNLLIKRTLFLDLHISKELRIQRGTQEDNC